MAKQSIFEKQARVRTPLYFFENVTSGSLETYTYMLDRIILVKLKRGTAKVEINEREYTITSHHFVLLPPHSRVHVIHASCDMEATVVGFMLALQDVLLQRLGHSFFVYIFNQLVWQLSEEGEKSIDSFCYMYERACSLPRDVVTGDIIHSLINAFMLSFYQVVREKVDEAPDMSRTSKSLTANFAILLREHFKQHHDVSFYADKLCVSSKYLAQVIRENTGFTPKLAIDRSIGAEAIFLLSNTTLNIQEISLKLGFNDQSYFGRFFKRLFGVSPQYFRTNPDLDLMEMVLSPRKTIIEEEEHL